MPLGSIRIVSKRKGGIKPLPDELVIDVTRGHSVLANRHWLKDHEDDDERDRVIDAYDVDYEADWLRQGPMYKETMRIAQLVLDGYKVALMCWCSPWRCHAETAAHRVAQVTGVQLLLPPRPPRKTKRPTAAQSSLF